MYVEGIDCLAHCTLVALLLYFAATYTISAVSQERLIPTPRWGLGILASPTRAGVQVKGQAVSKNETDENHALHAILYGHAAVAIGWRRGVLPSQLRP